MKGLEEAAQQIPDVKAAYTLVATGGFGSFMQAVTEWANLAVTVGNAFLVLGGCYLMYTKIRTSKRRDRRKEDEVS